MATVTLTPARPADIAWRSLTDARWVALAGSTLLGTIDRHGIYIASDSHGDILGAFSDLAEAKRSIEDPESLTAAANRLAHAIQTRRDARWRRAAQLALLVAAITFAVVVTIIVAAIRP